MKKTSNLPIIAIIGVDGSGKSTLSHALCQWLNQTYPTKLCHLGRQTGGIARTIARLPFFGKKLDKNIVQKTNKARSNKGPNAFVACIMFILSLKRVYRFYKMLNLHKKGYFILTDRYPQTSVIGGLDGPDLTIDHPKSLVAKFLTKTERKLYLWMSSHQPTLIIRLNVNVETAMQRKPDHRLASITKKIESLQQITFNNSPIIDIDTTQSFEKTFQESKAAIQAAIKNTY